MAKKTVHVRRQVAASADAIWAVARQFCGSWHPFLEWVRAEFDGSGRTIRAFKAKGEDGIYRERLTYFSDADRELRYCHVEGIRDVVTYEASIHVIENDDSAIIEWQAEIDAPEPRASEIATGTAIVFEAGIAALEAAAARQLRLIAGNPVLAVNHTVARPGPLLLFLHGIGGNKKNWHRQMAVASVSHQAAALDLRGYGQSELGSTQTSIDDHCNDILRVMAAFNKDRVILCGMSLGSWIATSFAMRYPEKLSGLILSGGCTGMSEASEEEQQAFFTARQKPLAQGQAPKDFADGVVKIIAGPHASGEVLQELKDSMAAIPANTYRDALWCFTHPEKPFDFSKITCSVLMMTGENDRLATPSEIRSVAQRIHSTAKTPDVAFEMISGAGHLCNIENPILFNHHLSQFLQRLAP